MSYFPPDYPRVEVNEAEMPHTFEDWLKLHMQHGHIDFNLRASVTPEGILSFCIHTQTLDSITYDFQVHGHEVVKQSCPPSSGRIGDFSAVCEMLRAARLNPPSDTLDSAI